ncbi:alpha/beta-hydrolase [Vararia minispora EC-137]|uniref:Alpha/beta-hydrolase n=1 Tax=Vararia minispora EC-137 TaxID=1314806 RepID=A0ACB8QD04_9AGAM|nr:alpha/beta-hydrolase [Vararia minispora EC-137]
MPSSLVSFLAIALHWASTLASLSVKSVNLGYAVYQTDLELDEGVTSFLGIRFAAPPTGELRFRAPQLPSKEPGIQNATTQPAQCWQSGVGASPTSPFRKRFLPPPPTVSSEDCLFLKLRDCSIVSQMTLNLCTHLPVLVWIHGGGYTGGNTSSFPGQTVPKDSNLGLILVQIQYRLGPFGFLPGSEVKEDGTLNAGLLDQQFAFRWIQDHISKFGGDPAKVTIYGESAGAGSVLQHVVANGGHTEPQLFRQAMTSSVFLPSQFAFNDPISEASSSLNNTMFTRLIPASRSCTTSKNLACLRSIDASTLNDASVIIADQNFNGVFSWVPVIDEKFIVQRPTVSIQENRINAPISLVVTNAHEGDIFTNPAQILANNFTLEEYISELFPRMDSKSIQQASALYSKVNTGDITAQAADVYGEAIFVCPSFFILEAAKSPAWKGEFAVPPALHGNDVNYVFADPTVPPVPFNNPVFIHNFQQAFFATSMSLNPNAHFINDNVTPFWPTWQESEQVMLFNRSEAGAPVVRLVARDSALLERCAFWHSVADVNSQ